MDKSSKDVDAKLSKSWRRWWRGVQIRNFDCEIWRQTWENWNRSSDQESKGINWRWWRTRYMFPVERKRPVFERRPMQFPARRSWACKTDTQNRSILWTTNTKRWKCVGEKEIPDAGVHLRSSLDSRVNTYWNVFAPNRFVRIGIFPNVNSIKRNRDVNSWWNSTSVYGSDQFPVDPSCQFNFRLQQSASHNSVSRYIDTRRAETSWKVFALNYLVTTGIFPNVSFTSQNRVVNSAQSAHSRTGRLKNNQTKSRKRVVTKVQWLWWKIHDSWVMCCRTQSRRNLYRLYGRAQESWDQFDECDSQKLRSVMQ